MSKKEEDETRPSAESLLQQHTSHWRAVGQHWRMELVAELDRFAQRVEALVPSVGSTPARGEGNGVV